MGYKIYQKEKVQNQVNTQDLRMLPNKELDGSSSCAHINYDECIYQSLIQHMKNQTSEFVPLSENKIKTWLQFSSWLRTIWF